MYLLIKDNVERIVLDECARDNLIKDGYKEVKKEPELNKLTVDQLKAIAVEKGLEFDPKIKKTEIIVLIESVEDGE